MERLAEEVADILRMAADQPASFGHFLDGDEAVGRGHDRAIGEAVDGGDVAEGDFVDRRGELEEVIDELAFAEAGVADLDIGKAQRGERGLMIGVDEEDAVAELGEGALLLSGDRT